MIVSMLNFRHRNRWKALKHWDLGAMGKNGTDFRYGQNGAGRAREVAGGEGS
jgi:hypothetical protein